MILLYVHQYFHTAVHIVEKAPSFKGSSTYFLHQNHRVWDLKIDSQMFLKIPGGKNLRIHMVTNIDSDSYFHYLRVIL